MNKNESSAIQRSDFLPQISELSLVPTPAGGGGLFVVQALLVAHERLMAAQHVQRMPPMPA